ncbi:related to excision repair protein RAD4) [Rhynchosporium secalis]|uniref:Related to excision repair protein RAD4 n=1 Tax=Rhynchosporium secalis TaxID=38038 RepID=A0A1E1M8V4_RHYSE|nr:related to excision repair protein RAD4) [Rhynchosporium secalis]
MPPFLPRKRFRSNSPEAGPSNSPHTNSGKARVSTSTTPRKPTLFDDLDAGTGSKRSAEHKKALLEKLAASDDDESSLSSLSDEEFEDVPAAKRQKTAAETDDEDEDVEFEDVETNPVPRPAGPEPSGDLELTLTKDTRVSITNPFGTKKGPSKIERGIRVATHHAHVQFLMYHNAIRNGWCCDKELQDILVKHLSPTVTLEVEKWKRNSGLISTSNEAKDETPKGKGKSKAKDAKGKKTDPRSQRDWGQPAQRLAEGQVNMSSGDPIIRLLKILISFWKQRFRIIAPGLRKLGYMSLQRLDEEIKSFRDDEHDPERHGERIRNVGEFRECAKHMEGSRDVGSQLFTALMRGLGLEARLVANLQPVGFGWSQVEEATEKNPRVLKKPKTATATDDTSDDDNSSDEEEKAPMKPTKTAKIKAPAKPTKVPKQALKTGRKHSRASGLQDAPISLSDSDEAALESDESIIDVTPARRGGKPSLAYDKDLIHPHYWTEVISPVTNTYIPVDPIVLQIAGTNQQSLERFETRGAKSEKAKQVTAYIIGHSSDGTAKDVTTRYLKRHVWPGRTKGNRFPAEKVPIYNRHGKVKRYEQKDWFKQVMSGYTRGTKLYPRTEIDDHEELTDLKPVKAEKKEVEEGKETLQYYKSSPQFVLERHFKREEALLPTAKHVKMFTVKGKGETSTEEKVFLRKDVVNCKTMETWHKEGRAPKLGEQPLKRVPYRAATTNRRRELAEAENASGEKVLQGLYSREQTEWIIPPPIENGAIPKNAFGNIDLYVDSMLPKGAVHIPARGTVKICKRLGIDYAEAVVGFEFGHRMAVPVINGVVVAEEHYDIMMEEWHKDEAERVRKEDEKARKLVLHTWRKMLMGLRIIERVNEEFGAADGEADILNPFASKKKRTAEEVDSEAQKRLMDQNDEEMGGGFLPEGFDAEEPEDNHREAFYPVAHEEDDDGEGGGFVVEGHDEPAGSRIDQAYATSQSLEFATIGGKPPTSKCEEEDVEMQDTMATSQSVPKKRGRPTGSSNKTAKAPAKTPAKRIAPPKKARARKTAKTKTQILESELDNDDDDASASSSPLEQSESVVEAKPKKKRAPSRPAGRRATLPPKPTETPRKTPRRQAARKSETALKSHYFEHSDDEDDEDDDE